VSTIIQTVDTATFAQRRDRGNFRLLLTSVSRRLDDPDHYFGELYLTGSSQNYGRVSDAQLDSLYQSQSQKIDQGARAALVRELEMRALNVMPWIPVTWDFRYVPVRPDVLGYVAAHDDYGNSSFEAVWFSR
jgi:ABC-type transport system substrate-binding protein